MDSAAARSRTYAQSLRRRAGELVAEFVLFGALAAVIVLLQQNNVLVFTFLIGVASIVFALWHDRYDRWSFLVVAILGTSAETYFVHFGVWSYANPTVFGIPLWFPVAFGTSAVIGERLIRTITRSDRT